MQTPEAEIIDYLQKQVTYTLIDAESRWLSGSLMGTDYSPYTLTCTLTYTLTYTLKTLSLLLENFWQLVRKRYMLGYMLQNIYRFLIPITIGTYSHSGYMLAKSA